jgi:hypothetical protein
MLVISSASGCRISSSTSLMVALSSRRLMLVLWMEGTVCGVADCHAGLIRGVVTMQVHLSWIQAANLCWWQILSSGAVGRGAPPRDTPGRWLYAVLGFGASPLGLRYSIAWRWATL